MGKTYTPMYRIELNYKTMPGLKQFGQTPSEWKVKEYGKPTTANIETYIYKFIESLKPSGCNYHISQSLGYLPIPNAAKIIRQKSSKIVAEWKAPMFMVI
jgi:hypothetical protein